MAEGQLRCVGSSLFLKKQYGVGYQLTIERHLKGESEADEKLADSLEDIVKEDVPDASLLTKVGAEMTFQLPLGSSSNFSSMLDQLDQEVEKESISCYGLGITTLDEVFLMVARGEDTDAKDFKSSRRLVNDDTGGSQVSQVDLEEKLFKRHVGALFQKRAANFKRDKKAWCCTTILPSLFVLVGFIMFEYLDPQRNMQVLDLTLDSANPGSNVDPIPYNNATSFQCQPGNCFYPIPFVNETDTNELYSYCGFHAYLGPSSKCSIENYTKIIEDGDGAVPVKAPGANVSEVSTTMER